MTNNSKVEDSIKNASGMNLSIGSGIAIAAIWLFATVLTIFAALFCFTDVFPMDTSASTEASGSVDSSDYSWAFMICLVIVLLPGFAAFRLTKMLIGENDD